MISYKPLYMHSFLNEQLRECSCFNTLSNRDRNNLMFWLYNGHDITSNPWGYCYENGWDMDYITALKLDEETYELMKRMAEEN